MWLHCACYDIALLRIRKNVFRVCPGSTQATAVPQEAVPSDCTPLPHRPARSRPFCPGSRWQISKPPPMQYETGNPVLGSTASLLGVHCAVCSQQPLPAAAHELTCLNMRPTHTPSQAPSPLLHMLGRQAAPPAPAPSNIPEHTSGQGGGSAAAA